MIQARPILSLAFLLFVSIPMAPAARPTPPLDYMLTSRTAMIVLDCDPPSCRLLMNKEDDFIGDNGWVLSRATHFMQDWGRYRILDDIREADLVLRLECVQPNFRDLLYGLRNRWIKMEVYAGANERWQEVQPIWKGQLDPVPTCDCRDAVIHMLTAYRTEMEHLEQARGKSLPRPPARPVLKPGSPQSGNNK